MVLLSDRRRVNGPLGSTIDPGHCTVPQALALLDQRRTRLPGELRKLYFKTGLVPSASGSAYLEISSSRSTSNVKKSGLKIACTVHGPRPLPRSAPFSPHLILSTRVKYMPFASSRRGGYVPDSVERDLASQLEGALRPVLLTERWPKSALDVIITIIESEENRESTSGSPGKELSMMNMLSGCVNVASAAIADAGIDCIDLLTVGVAAYVHQPDGQFALVLDPCTADPETITSICAVGYLRAREELNFVWLKEVSRPVMCEKVKDDSEVDHLIDGCVEVAKAVGLVCIEAFDGA